MCKGLSTLQGPGVRVRRVRVRVRTFWPSTNPWPLSRVRGFPGVSQGFYFSQIKVQIEFKQCWIGENIIQRGLTTFAILSIVQNTLNPSYFIDNLLKTMCISKLSLYLFTIYKAWAVVWSKPLSKPCWGFLPSNPWHTLTLTLQNLWPLKAPVDTA